MDDIKIISAFGYEDEIRVLFEEYTRMLIEGDPVFADYLKIQHFDDEMNDLTLKYGEPDGKLYIAFCKGEAAGCIGLKKLEGEICEMKRLYVRPAFRGLKLGRILSEKILEDAKALGYEKIRLDTLPFLQSAISLYKSQGFYEIPCYIDSPMSDAIYLEKAL